MTINIKNITLKLCEADSYKMLFHKTTHGKPMPSVQKLEKIVETLKEIFFPGYFGNTDIKAETMEYYIGSKLDYLSTALVEQIQRGFCFSCREVTCSDCTSKAEKITQSFFDSLPEIREILSTDVQAAYEGDPAAKSYEEAIFCYPSLIATTYYRIAHKLLTFEVPLIPRIITELAHSKTGIDIHPGAKIGKYFFIDHGTGTVIGETCEIGEQVRIYQGVTLGAKSFTLDENGHLVKGIKRHPIVEDKVTIYSGATILGRVTIGEGTTIGGNVWLTHSVPKFSKILQGKPSNEDPDKSASF